MSMEMTEMDMKMPTNEDNEGKQGKKTTEDEGERATESAKGHDELNNCEDLTISKMQKKCNASWMTLIYC